MAFIPERDRKMTSIPVRLVDGHLEFFYGGQLPALRPDTIGELVVPSCALADPAQAERFSQRAIVPLLPPGTSLWVEINPHKLPRESPLRRFITNQTVSREARRTIEVVEIIVGPKLETDGRKLNWLEMETRGFKLGVLREIPVHMPALPDKAAISVNEAYSIVSAAFEPHRRSHAGNVFDRVYFLSRTLGGLMPLNALRSVKEAEVEDEFIRAAWIELKKAYGIKG